MEPTLIDPDTRPEEGEYSDDEEAIDVLLEIQGVLGVLMSRAQPAYIQALLNAADRRARSVTERSTSMNWVH